MWAETVAKNAFKKQLQTPWEFLAGVKFTPQAAKGLNLTLAGGRGITNGVGSPDWRAMLGVNFRHERTPPPVKPVEVEAVVEEKIVITQKIHFEFDRAVIRPISYPILNDVANILKQNPQLKKIRIGGHTDWIGPTEYNQKLSERRADSVRQYLVQQGVEPDRLEAVGYGESNPIADNNTTMGRAKNRRVEFTVIQ